MEPEGSLPCSQEPTSISYPEPDESSPHPPHSISVILTLKLLPSTPTDFNTKIRYEFLIYIMRATCYANLILHDLITQIDLTSGEEHKLLVAATAQYL
jgi:hypothetical protein